MALKLLVIAEGFPWRDSLQGVFHRDQMRLMVEAGIDVTLVGPTPWVPPGMAARNARWAAYDDLPRQQTESGVEILRPRYLAVPRENRWFFPDIMQELAIRLIGLPKPDLIQAFFALPQGAAARRLARSWNIPYCVGMLGDDVNIYPHLNGRNMRLLSEVVTDADFAFANGPTLAATASRLTGAPVESLSIGVSNTRFANLPSRAEARAALGLPMDRPLALYVGALIQTKGMAELIAAMRHLQGTEILAVVIGDGAMRGDLEAQPNVRCLGIQPAARVAIAMAAADFLVYPSHYEGLPTALVEAALARLPIITTDAPGCIDLARDGRAAIVPVGDSVALAEQMAAVSAEREARSARAALMYEHVAEHYLLERNTMRLMDKYQELTGLKI